MKFKTVSGTVYEIDNTAKPPRVRRTKDPDSELPDMRKDGEWNNLWLIPEIRLGEPVTLWLECLNPDLGEEEGAVTIRTTSAITEVYYD